MNESVTETADILKALGDPTRLKILKIIASGGNRLCVGAVAGRLGISQPAVSQHLKVLKGAGLVEARREGNHIHYAVRPERVIAYGIDLPVLLNSFAEAAVGGCGGPGCTQ